MMSTDMIGAIEFIIDELNSVKIYPAGMFQSVNWGIGEVCPLGKSFMCFSFKQDTNSKEYLFVKEDVRGHYSLRLLETKRYKLRIESNNGLSTDLVHFQNENNKFLKIERDEETITFQFINYLGHSKISFDTCEGLKQLCFEVVPDKMDYEDDYIKMTESIAETCSELLLEYSGATSNFYRQNDNSSDSLLEQFIFLRQFCYSENIQGLFEMIKRNPDSVLVSEEILKPIGSAVPSRKFFTNPFAYSSGWQKVSAESNSEFYLPLNVAVTRKYDSLDTPANRFIKTAIQKFNNICEQLIFELADKNSSVKQTECLREAELIKNMLDEIMRSSFFDDIGELDVMPGNNQVLQKREGYSRIFMAYSMVDLALQLDWSGKDSIYEGESKNAALLYEYWLFFELHKIIRSIDGCEPVETDADAIKMDANGGLTISLKEDKLSRLSFKISKYAVKVNLYYNRTFSPTEFKTTRYEGSYSRPFRPDYTIAVFPDYFEGKDNGENEAIRAGEVSYIHFDAKYRVTDLTSFIGVSKDGRQLSEEEELKEDKADAVTNTYKRGDLLKMHTYNDAIRRTIGSYVLYPGDGGKKSYNIYDEILPGVGAFAIRPSNVNESEAEIRCFITKLIDSKQKYASRLNRMESYAQTVLSEPSVKELDERNKKGDVPFFSNSPDCIIGYIRDAYFKFLTQCGKLTADETFLFYFYAIKGKQVYSHHKDIARTRYFRFYVNDIRATGTYDLQPVKCEVLNNELISKSELVERLLAQGYKTREDDHGADFYYVITLKVLDEIVTEDSLPVNDVNSQNGNDTFSPHSPKIIKLECDNHA